MTLLSELNAERAMTAAEVVAAYEKRLDRPITDGLNTAHEACDRWARDRARLALIVAHPDKSSERWTFADLELASRRAAHLLSDLGVKRGDRVGGVLSRQVETWITALATWRLGAVYVPLYVGFGGEALAERLTDAEPALVICGQGVRDTVADGLGRMSAEIRVVTVAGDGGRGMRVGDWSFWAELERRTPLAGDARTLPEDPATLMYSSGTTGRPKGCIITHGSLLATLPFARHVFALEASDLFFSGADPGWSYGLYTTGVAVWALGLPRVTYSGDFDPAAWLRVCRQERVTYMAGAPSAFRRVVAIAQRDGAPPDLRGTTSAGEPLEAVLAHRWRETFGHDIQDGYGLTEMGMLLANLAGDRVVPGALASVVPGWDVELLNPRQDEATTVGILGVSSPSRAASIGYRNREELWQSRWHSGVFDTGDLFSRDAEGLWRALGRGDDLIVTSGYNVGPAEVESVLLEHPDVREAAVVAADDEARGKVVRAVVVSPRAGDQLATDLQRMVRDRIGRHAMPRVVDFVEGLPRTETGKLKHAALRAQRIAEPAAGAASLAPAKQDRAYR